MAFALLSKSQSKTQGSVKPGPKRKSAREPRPADSRPGFAKPVFQPSTPALPMAPVIQTKLKVGEPNDKFEQEADRVAELEADRETELTENGNDSTLSSAAAQSRSPVGNLQRLYGSQPVLQMRNGSGGLPAPSVPLHPSQSGILQRKCACGGAAGMSGECEECSKKKRLGLQTKLKVNEPGDIYEREADRIADQVMATPAHSAVSGAPPRIQRFSGQSNGQMDAAPASVDQALASPGRPLEPALRQDMEQRFGHDFSRVRVHLGAAAEQSVRDVNAHAYTVGHDMVFGAGRFAPRTQKGRQLLAHELTHIVQQAACGVASLQRKEKETEGSWLNLARAAERLSMASVGLYRLDPLLEIIEPESPISALATHTAVESKVAHPMGGPSEKIEAPFSDLGDLRKTLQAFESSLVSELRDGANTLLDATETKLISMSRQFVVGTGPYPLDPLRNVLEGHRQHGPGWAEREIEVLKKDPDIIKLAIDHKEYKEALDRELESKPSISNIAEYRAKLQKEQQRHNESLRQVVAKKSKLFFTPGFDVGDILHAKSGTIAQHKLIAFIVDAGSKVRDTRKKLGDRRFLYGADILISKVKERLAGWLGKDLNRSVVEDPVLGPRFREAEYSRRVGTVNEIIDKLTRERSAQTKPWEDIVKVLEVVSAFVPGPIGWGIRLGVAAAGFDIKIGRVAEQSLLYSGELSTVAPDPNAARSALGMAALQVLTDAPPLRAAKPGQLAQLGKRQTTHAPDVAASAKPPKPAVAETPKPASPQEPVKAVRPTEPPKPAALEDIPLAKPVTETLELGRIQQWVTLAGERHTLSIKRVRNQLAVWLCSNHCGELIERCDQLLRSLSDDATRARVTALRRDAELLQGRLNSGMLTAEAAKNELALVSRRLEQAYLGARYRTLVLGGHESRFSSRPSVDASEVTVGRHLGEGWVREPGFLHGERLRTGRRPGMSTHPDFYVQYNARRDVAAEVKNWDIHERYGNMIAEIKKQATGRVISLPGHTVSRRWLFIELRGQRVDDLAELARRIYRDVGNGSVYQELYFILDDGVVRAI
jgi:hypothetical protein